MKNRIFYACMTMFLCGIFVELTGCRDRSASNTSEKEGWTLVWQDEFDYTGLPDSTKWGYDVGGHGWGNNELEYYTEADSDNVWVADGVLTITARKEQMGERDYTSARMVTREKGDWLYGKVEVRAMLPTGRGVWPAIWMLPTDREYGNWPRSGEIDIMENVGFDPDTIVGSAHTLKYNHSIGTQRSSRIACPTCYSDFHVYGLEWEPDEYRLYVDDQLYFTFKNEGTGFEAWPFDKRFHLLLNIAVGGNWGGAEGVDDTIFPQKMVVDYVRVYQKQTDQ